MSRGVPVKGVRQAEALRKARKHLGMTQDEFARVLGVSQSTVQNWESGRTCPHRGTRARIHGLLGGNQPETPRPKHSKVAEETRLQLMTALETILERAPNTVIEELSRILTDRAGKYGGPE